MTLVFMFPGQSSRYPRMLDKLVELDARTAAVLEEASDVLGRDVGAHYRSDDCYGCNRDVQIGVFLANHMFLQILEHEGIHAIASLGLSLGEWNHVVHIGALPFREALAAVDLRGQAYDSGPRGAMASVFPLSLDELQEVVDKVKDVGVLDIANLNSPRQNVLSGETQALERALEILEDEHMCEAVVIERQVPMHSSMFEPVSKPFRAALEKLHFRAPRLPYLPNRLARFESEPDFVELLSTHVHRPVLWRDSIDLVHETWPDATLVEVGPKAVLHNLIDRKWHKKVRKIHMDSAEHTAEHLASVLEQLRATSMEAVA